MFKIEFLAVHTIQEKVNQVQNNRLAAFSLNGSYNIVIRVRMIFYEDFSYNTNLWLFNIPQRQCVKILYNFLYAALELPEASCINIPSRDAGPFFIQLISRPRNLFIRPCRI